MFMQMTGVGSTLLVRAQMLVREILLAFVEEVDDVKHPLVAAFGFDETTYKFVKMSTAGSLLKLAGDLVRANAMTIDFNKWKLKQLLVMDPGELELLEGLPSQKGSLFDHCSVIRSMVLFMVDSLSDSGIAASSISRLDGEIRKMLTGTDGQRLKLVANGLVKGGCVRVKLNKKKVKKRTYSHMVYERRERVKDMLVTKKATYGLMSFLFSEESEETVRTRRYRMGVEPLKGRPKTATPEDYAVFVCLWTANQDMAVLDRFLLVHKELGYDYDVIWNVYRRAEGSGEFDESVLAELRRASSRNRACQASL